MADAALEAALKEHVEMLAGRIGPRAPFVGDTLDRAKVYVRSAFEQAGLDVVEHTYDYRGSQVANLIANAGGSGRGSSYYVVGAHYDSTPSTPGADDNASAVAVL